MNNGNSAKSPALMCSEDAAMSKDPLYEIICNYKKTLKRSYAKALKGNKKYRKEAIIYDMARERNLVDLWRALQKETYVPGPYNQFEVSWPKRRSISAPKLRDKIVQYAVHIALWAAYEPVYIKDTYACLDGRGEHRAAERVQHFMRLCEWKHGSCWIIKLDIRKYFYTIDRDILKALYRKRIKDEKTLRLLDMIVDSSPEGDLGIPLGNVSSQDFANIDLNQLDQCAKRFLGIKYYVRYMDDVVIMTATKEEAERYLEQIEKFLEKRLHLETNEKTRIFPVAQGVNAYGFKIFTTHKMVRDSSKASVKRRIKKMDEKYRNGKMPLKDVVQSVNSWLGHARHSNSYNLAKKIFAPYDYITVEHKKYRFGVKLDAHK